ncbi:DegT/DnrJ/EryC1/StrS family aminotransferase [Candidatus Parcubacteria bacterium]|nr:DegT/DnrJ/EryC1/StrS family aminotransferase [Candidatus Parcubacteria bacterium]
MKNTWRFKGNEFKYIREVLDSGFGSSTSGNMCNRFEKAFADKVGAKYGIAFNSGTSTMHSCLAAVGVGPGDEVIVPSLTVISTANVVIHQNAVPIFADIDPMTLNIDPQDVAKRITERTKAIIPVSLYGLSPDLDPLMELAEKHNLAIINDAAEAHMAMYKGKNIGQLSHMTSYSLENSKHITTGDGGIVVTDNEELSQKIRKHASQGYISIKPKDGRIRINKEIFQDPNYKRHDALGWNYRMPEVAAAIGLAQVERIEEFIKLRQDIAKMYFEAIKDQDYFTPQYVPDGYVNTYYTYVAKFEGDKIGVKWQEFRKKYVELGGDGIYAAWSPVYLEPVYSNYNFYGKGCPHNCPLYKGKVEYKEGLCPVVERVQPKLMQFINNYGSIEEAEPKVEALKKTIEYFNQNKRNV